MPKKYLENQKRSKGQKYTARDMFFLNKISSLSFKMRFLGTFDLRIICTFLGKGIQRVNIISEKAGGKHAP